MTSETCKELIGMIDHQLIMLLTESIKVNSCKREEPGNAYWVRVGKRVALENLKIKLENIIEANRFALAE